MKSIANKVFPNNNLSISDIEAKYKPRGLNPDQWVVRMAPSPTGFMHLGAIYMGLLNNLIGKQSNGVSILRIEDTDQKRELENGAEMIVSAFKNFGLTFDEGVMGNGEESGEYGPYTQSKRKEIYEAYAKKLIEEGKAYPCFCTAEELDEIRKTQVAYKARTGYYGKFKRYANLTEEETLEKLEQGLPFVVRMRSNGDFDQKIDIKDIVRGNRQLPQNDIDPIIIKSEDGLPTYHFAHVVDDHLMGVTHVIRGDEWISSLPLHLDMFYTMGWKAPKYGHIAPIQKMDGQAKRKLSKRKDPEANIELFLEEGYPVEAIVEYLLNLANSNFEDWRKNNPTADATEFKVDIKKTSLSGALFDWDKLINISKNTISEFTNVQAYDQALAWAQKYDASFAALLTEKEDYIKNILNIERTGNRKRKDIVKWSSLKTDISYFFDDMFEKPDFSELNLEKSIINSCLSDFAAMLDASDERSDWWNKVKEAAEKNNFATDMKYYKEHKDEFNGNIADYMKVVRVALTGLLDSPDVFEIMHVLSLETTKARLNASIA